MSAVPRMATGVEHEDVCTKHAANNALGNNRIAFVVAQIIIYHFLFFICNIAYNYTLILFLLRSIHYSYTSMIMNLIGLFINTLFMANFIYF